MSIENISIDLYNLDQDLYSRFTYAVQTSNYTKIREIQREIIDTKSRIQYPDSPKIIREIDNYIFDAGL